MLFANESAPPDLLVTSLRLLSLPILVALNGFFVAAEFALVAVRRTRIEEMVAKNVLGAKAVQSALDHLDRSIASTQLGITLTSIGLGVVSERGLSNSIEWVFASLPNPINVLATEAVASTIAFAIITFLHVVLGELFPKTVALQVPDTTSLWVAQPLAVFTALTRPLILIMNGAGNQLARMCGLRDAGSESLVHSVEELALLIEDTEEAGILDPEHAELVQNVFRLSSKTVADCMVPRDRMAALELNTPPNKVLEAVRSGAHTRLPVFQADLDNVVGIVNTKDLFYLFSLQGIVVLDDAIYPALFLKPDEELANALRLFKKAKRPMALVRDEDNRIHGLITLEDILEEIIGDIEDEHDQPRSARKRFRRLGSAIPKPPDRKS